MNISVLGCGRWGSCIAWYLDKIGHNVLSCGLADAPEFIQLKETHKNDYLTFPKSIEVSSDLEYAIERAEVIIISISSQYLRSYFADISKYNLDGKTIVLCMKGVEATTGKRLSEVVGEFVIEVAQEFVNDVLRVVSHIELVGIREEIALALHKAVRSVFILRDVLPEGICAEIALVGFLQKLLGGAQTGGFPFLCRGTVLIGSKIGRAAKNVIGIAAGMLDGLNYTSLKGALMARGTREIARLIKALGGNEMSAYGLCHLGDYEATLFSKWSHNRMYGESFAKGDRFTKLAEGVMTSKALYKLGQEYGVDLPIVESVYKVLFDGTDIKEALGTLFMRSVKKEF